MHTLKFGLEKPFLIWAAVAILSIAAFWGGGFFHIPPVSESETLTIGIIKQFADSTFPPRIALIREVPDWGHLGYYAVFGRIFHIFGGQVVALRAAGLVVILASFLVFVSLAYRVTYRNRLNPLWISLCVLVLAANPYSWQVAFHFEYTGLLLLTLLAAMFFFERELIGWAAIFTSLGVLVDWRALLLALAFLVARMTGEKSRFLRPERMLAMILPFFTGFMILAAWHGVVPQGEASQRWESVLGASHWIRPDGFFYSLSLLPLYALFFSWSWGIRARSRALTLGAIATAVLIPLYFIFPIHFDFWSEMKDSLQIPLGLVDQGALSVAGSYKNLLLFVPWIIGTFLFCQLCLMDILDRSRWLRYFIIMFFAVQPIVIGAGDCEFLIVLPAVLLFSLAEALVGEEGKLA